MKSMNFSSQIGQLSSQSSVSKVLEIVLLLLIPLLCIVNSLLILYLYHLDSHGAAMPCVLVNYLFDKEEHEMVQKVIYRTEGYFQARWS